MKGYVEHDSRACTLGGHTNRGPVADMCPVYLELRRQRLKTLMRKVRYETATDRTYRALSPLNGAF